MTPRTGILLATGLALALSGAIAVAKVEEDPTKAPPQASPPQPVHQAPLHARCWQKGVKIVDEEDLEGLSITAATRESTVTFKRGEGAGASVFLLPLGEALCLLEPEG